MLKAMDAVREDNPDIVAQALTDFSICATELGIILTRMYERCAPEVFYHRIRPFLAGSKNMANAGLPNGIFYDEGDGKGQWRQYNGGSNAQSSLIQFLDIVLGVEHSATGNRSKPSDALQQKQSFIQVRTACRAGAMRPF